MPEEMPENYKIGSNFVSKIEKWTSEHDRPNEACLPVGDSSYSPNQVLDEVRAGSELGKRLAFGYDRKVEGIVVGCMKDWLKITFGATGSMILAAVATVALTYSTLPEDNYRNNPIVLEHQSAIKTLSRLERERNYLEGKINLTYQPEEVKPHLEKVFGEEFDKISSLDEAIEVIRGDIERLEDTEEVKAKERIDEEEIKKGKYFGYGFLGACVGVVGCAMGLVTMSNRKMKKKIRELLS